MTFQDKKGYLWVCSNNGVVKYDGANFKYFTISNGLPINDIWFIGADNSSRHWLGGFYEGLSYIKDDKVFTLRNAPKHKGILFNCQKGDTLFFTAILDQFSSYYYLNGEFKPSKYKDFNKIVSSDVEIYYRPVEDEIPRRPTGIKHFKNKDTLWAVSSDLREFLLRRQQKFIIVNGGNDAILIKDSSLVQVDINRHFNCSADDLKSIMPTGEVTVSGVNGFNVYNNLSELTRDSELENKLVNYVNNKTAWILKDNEDNFWITLFRGDIIYLSGQSDHIKTHKLINPKSTNNFKNPVLIDKSVYFQSISGEVIKYDRTDPSLLSIVETKQKVFELLAYKDSLIILEAGSISTLTGNRITHFEGDDLAKVAFRSRGGKMIDRDTFLSCNFNTFTLEDNKLLPHQGHSISFNHLSEILETSDHYISGGINGLYGFNKHNNKITKISETPVNCIVSNKGNIFIGTSGNSIIVTNQDLKKTHNIQIRNTITSIEFYDTLMIVGTKDGLYCGKLIEPTKEFVLVRRISTADGLASNEVSGVAIDENIAYVTTVNGLSVINISEILAQPQLLPKIYLNNVFVNDSSANGNHEFNSDENNLTFLFSSVSLNNLKDVVFEYQINSGDWTTSNLSEAVFNSLSAGSYVFKVRAVGPSGAKSETIEYPFTINKHFSEQPLFLLMLFLLGLAALWAIVNWRQRLKNQKLTMEKSLATLELKALQSQMNPHFIFNSLNGIQSVMLLKGEKETNKYIGNFSDLMRATLEHSKAGEISMKEEIEFLELYLSLEKRRLSGNLTYEIEVDKDLDLDANHIPSMLIQPLVENAILHGLIPKKEDRNLKVRFIKQVGNLVVEVEDNGIGRTKAGEKSKKHQHRSLGSTILKERIEVMNRMEENEIELKITDKFDGELATGTKIEMRLKLEHD